jgi:trk system potassium uptake protein TrkH
MLVGACAGSTGGGVKVYRAIILFKSGIKEIRYVMNPRSVITVKMDGKPVEPEVTKGVMSYTAICIFIMIISLLALTFDQYSIEETASAVITCINNIGPGIGRLGPCGSFAGFTDISKYILSLDMLI